MRKHAIRIRKMMVPMLLAVFAGSLGDQQSIPEDELLMNKDNEALPAASSRLPLQDAGRMYEKIATHLLENASPFDAAAFQAGLQPGGFSHPKDWQPETEKTLPARRTWFHSKGVFVQYP
jgi:hypothetical protein